MNKISTTLSIIALTLFFAACGGVGGGYQGESALQKELFKIHDEVMPLSQNIYLIRKDLIDVKSNGTFDQKTLTAAEKSEVDSVCILLTRAEEGMNTWMRGYKEPEYGTSMSAADAFFTAELPKIKAVAEMVNTSVEKAKALSERFPIRAAEVVKTEVKKTTTKRDTTRKSSAAASSTPKAASATEQPKAEAAEKPKAADTEKPDAPEVPKAETPKPEAPKVETPKAEAPLVPKAATSPRVAPAGSKIAR